MPPALFAQSDAPSEAEHARRIAASLALAEDAYAVKDVETGNLHLKDVIENSPGRWDIACPALTTILHESKNGPEAWREYAAVRLEIAHCRTVRGSVWAVLRSNTSRTVRT
jgi:hypothetical protein